MAKKFNASQFKSQMRQQINKTNQAIRNYNSAVNNYNREVKIEKYGMPQDNWDKPVLRGPATSKRRYGATNRRYGIGRLGLTVRRI